MIHGHIVHGSIGGFCLGCAHSGGFGAVGEASLVAKEMGLHERTKEVAGRSSGGHGENEEHQNGQNQRSQTHTDILALVSQIADARFLAPWT